MKEQGQSREINRIQKRAIEAQAVIPVIRAVAESLGWENAMDILRDVNQQEAFQRGKSIRKSGGQQGIDELADEIASWGEGGVWIIEVLERTATTYFFNVTRCPYYEKYRKLGIEQFGVELSCCRDEPFARGFNPHLKLVRSKTIMEGADHCDFRYYLISGKSN